MTIDDGVLPTRERVSGHALQRAGYPFDDAGTAVHGYSGRAKCQCGALSEILASDSARKSWHRQHKGYVLAEKEGA